jgi:NAD(P)-dependent dehydrogenase (short-subunit alcohol dehydrogenase family)
VAKIDRNGALKGQVAVVTGASRGIGEAIARRFAMAGAKVVVSARTVEADDHYLPGTITDTVDRIKAAGGEAIAVRADLASAEDRRHLIQAAEAAFGQVDILVNNAAITYFIPVEDFPEKRFRLMMDVQVWAPFELAQMVLPGMKERGHGWILNISSHAAIHPQKTMPGRGGTVYHAKAALGPVRRAWRRSLSQWHRQCDLARSRGDAGRAPPDQQIQQGPRDTRGAWRACAVLRHSEPAGQLRGQVMKIQAHRRRPYLIRVDSGR